MPTFVNGTNVSSSTNSNISSLNHTPIDSSIGAASLYDPSNNLGYGTGRLLKDAFDQVWRTWQGFWNPAPSQDEIALQRQTMIYKQGLAECVTHLDRAIDNLRKNPNDPQSVERIKKLAAHYERYVNPAPTEELRSYRQKVFQRIAEKIEKFATKRLKETLMQFLPLWFSKHVSGSETQELTEKSSAESVVSKSKRTVMQEFSATFDLTSLDGRNGFTVPGVIAGGGLGYSVNTAGDVNGDNITDLVLGAAGVDHGTSYVIFGSRDGFPAVFNLSALNGSNGFSVPGIASIGFLGRSLSTAGDVNGDNITDLVLGAPWDKGTSYVIFGNRSGFPAVFNLTTLNGNNGFSIPGIESGGKLGTSVSTAGDLNGDTIADLVLGAYDVNSGNGTSYIIFGNRSGFPAVFDLTTLNGNNGFSVPGIVSDGGGLLGHSVSGAGDINGDNIADLVLGAHGVNSLHGTSYVIFGSRNSFPPVFNLSTLNGSTGFTIPGIVRSDGGRGQLGFSVNTAGDINGDNIADLVLGAYGANLGNGTSYIIFGNRGGFPEVFNLTTLNGNNGFSVPGIADKGLLGVSVSTAGDVNGDNVADLVLGAYNASSGNGTSYVIFGSHSSFPAVFDLTTLNGSNGFNVPGIADKGLLGVSVSTAGDVNGDNIADLVLGAYGVNLGNGTSYVIFGQNVSILPTPSPTQNSDTVAIASGVVAGIAASVILAGLGYGFFKCAKKMPDEKPLLDPASTGHRP